MMAINGRIHGKARWFTWSPQKLFDLSADLSGLAGRDGAFQPTTGRRDEFAHGSPANPDSREKALPRVRARDMFTPGLHIDNLKIKSRNFH